MHHEDQKSVTFGDVGIVKVYGVDKIQRESKRSTGAYAFATLPHWSAQIVMVCGMTKYLVKRQNQTKVDQGGYFWVLVIQ